MIRRVKVAQFGIFLFTFCLTLTALAQRPIRGTVVDKETKSPLAGVSLSVVGADIGTSTTSTGQFSLASAEDSVTVEFNRLGYEVLRMVLSMHQDYYSIELDPMDNVIEGITVEARRRYSNRNNPAVELIDSVIAYKGQNKLSGKQKIQYDQYDKLKFGFVNPNPSAQRGLPFLGGLFDNVDTVTLSGQRFMPIYMEENLAQVFSQKNPSRYKKRITNQQKTEFDQRYVNNPNIQSYLNFIFQEIDIYDESIFLMNKQFLSPLADNGKVFYRYYIVDTISNEYGSFINLNFVPRNETDLLFSGNLRISMDGRYAVKGAELRVGRSANLNWINSVDLTFTYSPNEDNIMLLDTAETKVSFGIIGRESMYGERISVHDNYDLRSPIDDRVFAGAPIEVPDDVNPVLLTRPLPLSEQERQTYRQIDELNRDPSFRTLMAVGYLIAQSYYSVGAFEIGPLEYMYSRNNVEGNRFRIGGRSTPLLSEKLYLEGYLAYGDLDNSFKYFVRSAVSLNGANIATFPAHYIEGSAQHDILEPGRDTHFLRGDSFFMSLRRNRPTKWFMTDAYRLRHVVEFGNHVSIATAFTHTRRHTVGDFRLVSSGDPNELLTDINTNEAEIELRWAPYEKFYYRNLVRSTIVERYPVFTVTYQRGLSGFWGGDYDYDKISAAASKRFFLNLLGFADVTVSAGKIWGTLPYTLLHLPNVRLPENRHTITYDLMNSIEFAADEYVRFGIFHQMEGFLFNKVPLLKRLRLREIWGAQMFYGKMSDHNRPELSNQVVEFDTDADGLQITRGLGTHPYWEASAGVDNILRILRLEYVRRLTHTNFPNISNDRLRLTMRINF